LPFRFFCISPFNLFPLAMLDLDPTTQSNYWQIASEHVSLDWAVDFAAQIISGSATHRMNVLVDGVEEAM
jgi:leukotriene-A4 hydrolase